MTSLHNVKIILQSIQISNTQKHFRDCAKQLMLPARPSKPSPEDMEGQIANESIVFTLLRRSRLKPNLDLNLILLCEIFHF